MRGTLTWGSTGRALEKRVSFRRMLSRLVALLLTKGGAACVDSCACVCVCVCVCVG